MKTKLKLFLEWGIRFEEPYAVEERAARVVQYANQHTIEQEMIRRYNPHCVKEGDIPIGRDDVTVKIEYNCVEKRNPAAQITLGTRMQKYLTKQETT